MESEDNCDAMFVISAIPIATSISPEIGGYWGTVSRWLEPAQAQAVVRGSVPGAKPETS